jgi:hypothetical protein
MSPAPGRQRDNRTTSAQRMRPIGRLPGFMLGAIQTAKGNSQTLCGATTKLSGCAHSRQGGLAGTLQSARRSTLLRLAAYCCLRHQTPSWQYPV